MLLPKVNATNLLTVVVLAQTIYLYVNKVYLAQATDTTYNSGEIGVFVQSTSQSFTEVAFKNAQVWKL